jgi:hypothetical protein
MKFHIVVWYHVCIEYVDGGSASIPARSAVEAYAKYKRELKRADVDVQSISLERHSTNQAFISSRKNRQVGNPSFEWYPTSVKTEKVFEKEY